MKRLLSLLLAAVLCCTMFGCGGSESEFVQEDAPAVDWTPSVLRAYTLTLEREREFTPELGTEAAYAAEYSCIGPEEENLHLLLLRFDHFNQIPFPNSLYTPDSYYVVYDIDTDKIYDSEMMYAQIQGGLPNLTQRDEVLLWVLNRYSDEYRTGSIYQDGETLRVFGDMELEAVNAKLGELNDASLEQAKQVVLDAAARFNENPPKGYTASGTLFHGVEYKNPDVKGTPVHCYLMDIRGEFRSKSDYRTRVVLAVDAETGETYSSLDPQYQKVNRDNPSNIFLFLLKSYDISGIDTSDIYFSSGETVIPLYGGVEALAPAMTQEELAAKVAEIVGAWLADSGEIIAESVYVRKAAEVRCRALYGYAVDNVFVELEGNFRDSRKSDKIPPATSYFIGCDRNSGAIYTEDDSHAFMNTAPEYINSIDELTLEGLSGYQSYVRRDASSVYGASEEMIALDQMGIFTANKGFDHQISEEKLNP